MKQNKCKNKWYKLYNECKKLEKKNLKIRNGKIKRRYKNDKTILEKVFEVEKSY